MIRIAFICAQIKTENSIQLVPLVCISMQP